MPLEYTDSFKLGLYSMLTILWGNLPEYNEKTWIPTFLLKQLTMDFHLMPAILLHSICNIKKLLPRKISESNSTTKLSKSATKFCQLCNALNGFVFYCHGSDAKPNELCKVFASFIHWNPEKKTMLQTRFFFFEAQSPFHSLWGTSP